jgi:lipopolysaccharide transport system permease protein
MGWLWAVIQPAAQAAILAVVFTYVIPVDVEGTPYLLFSYVATVPWTFLSSSLTDMTMAIVENMGVVTKIYFPREILPLAMMLARLLDMVIAFTLFFGLAIYFGAPAFSLALLMLPVVLFFQVVLVTGIGLACAAGNVFVRDVRSVLVLVIQLWFYASPVIYPSTLVPEALRPYTFLNPMIGLLDIYRSILLYGQVPGFELLVAGLVSVAVFSLGYTFFKRVEFRFADIV